MRVYYDRDADLNLIKGKKVAIIGYGSQGHAHALNLRDSGVKEVAVALRKSSQGVKKAQGEKLPVKEVAEAAKLADVMMMLTPDELQADIYYNQLHANMKEGAALMFAHGLNVHFNLIEPRADLDVMMIAPKGPGHTVRSEYQRGTLLHVFVQMLAVDVALQFVRGQHHHEVGPFGGVRHLKHLEAGGLRLLGRGRALAQRNGDVLDPGILQVQRMGVALAAIADDGDLLALDEIDVGIPVIINTHEHSLLKPAAPRRSARSRGRIRWRGS